MKKIKYQYGSKIQILNKLRLDSSLDERNAYDEFDNEIARYHHYNSYDNSNNSSLSNLSSLTVELNHKVESQFRKLLEK